MNSAKNREIRENALHANITAIQKFIQFSCCKTVSLPNLQNFCSGKFPCSTVFSLVARKVVRSNNGSIWKVFVDTA